MESGRPYSPLDALGQRNVLLLGSTGFLAKVMLGLLLERLSIRKVYCLVRSTRSLSAESRFRDEVLGSEVFKKLRQRFGPSFEALVDSQVEVVDGDLSRPQLGMTGDSLERLQAELDLVINSAGLVSFNPPLEQALEANACGAENVARFTASCDHAKLVHVSTCFVVGSRSGRIREDAPIVGYFPKHDEMPGVTFDFRREIRDLRRLVDQIKSRTDDAALEAAFRQEALDRLKREGREAHERTLRAAMTNQRRRWMNDEQIRVGLERARAWGWPNIYTFTKALGEQAVASVPGLDWAIVRPAIVESAVSYPFPGWNEGMNTSAPLAYMAREGQVVYPGTNDLILDVVPVDSVASATIAAGAALVQGDGRRVYQVAAGDVNPCSMARTVHLVGIYRRRYIREREARGELTALQARFFERIRPVPRTRKQYERLGAPAFKKLVSVARQRLDDMDPERFGSLGEFVHKAQRVAQEVEADLDKVTEAFDLFMPFVWENRYVFLTRNTRRLFDAMTDADRALLPYDVESLDWRHYWLDIHLPGLEKWVFPRLSTQGPKRIQIHRDYKDLTELFESRTREHARRTAYRVLRKDDVAEHFSYRDVRKAAKTVQAFLRDHGIVEGDRVALASEGRPEWGICYFGILLAGATAVPIDTELSSRELHNILASSGVKGVIASDKARSKLHAGNGEGNGQTTARHTWAFETVFAHRADEEDLLPVVRRPEDVASVIYTSGTTGRPKGVVLTDRNFTALTARMAALFELRRGDALLSVLPPYHTFEFSAGLLMPLAAGASVTYLEERTPELMQRAFRETPVTALIGVPAVWESMHRRIQQRLEELPFPLRWLFAALARANRTVREWNGLNIGRFAFGPIHGAFGGRLRYLVSGGAPLRHEIFNDLRGYGFSIYEGYGLTEASPVLTVGWPGQRFSAGTVGWPLPGVEVRTHDPDETGTGEVIARGPTIMSGYLDDPEATSRALQDGWLFTGDRGYFDDDGRLYIVGRTKDVIIDASGKNVYPDEIEELYASTRLMKELSVVGLPADAGEGEQVAALVHPDYAAGEAEGLDRERTREEIRRQFREVGSKLTFSRKIKLLHFVDRDLPRTSTKKIKRDFVRDELSRREAGRQQRFGGARSGNALQEHVRRIVAQVAQRKVEEVALHDRLVDKLGFDSLLQLELLTALEHDWTQTVVQAEELAAAETVADVVRLLERQTDKDRAKQDVGHEEEGPPFTIPEPFAETGKQMLGRAQRYAYLSMFDIEVDGEGNIPANRNFIVAANHTSHLDMGLAKFALGRFGDGLRSLAAKDYFFDDPLRRAYFENFTYLLPIERNGSLRRSLRLASRALREGYSLLIFPEGTRARDGIMTAFRPAVGYLCLHDEIDILPMYLGGTYEALPAGAWRPRPGKLRALIGAPLTASAMRQATQGMSRSRAYRDVSLRAENAVRALGGLPLRTEDGEPSGRPRLSVSSERIS